MAGAMNKKVDKIRQIVPLKQLMTRWKHISLRRSSSSSDEPSAVRRPPSGFIFVYVGPERTRFAIPARFLNLALFEGLLKQTEEEFGLRGNGGLVLPCQVPFFSNVVKYLHKDEHKYGSLSLQDFVNMLSDADVVAASSDSCKEKSSFLLLCSRKQRFDILDCDSDSVSPCFRLLASLEFLK